MARNLILLEGIDAAIAKVGPENPVINVLRAARAELLSVYNANEKMAAELRVARRRPKLNAAERRTIAEALKTADGHVVALMEPGEFASLRRRIEEGAKA
jgi:hypothetical protein